MGNTPSIEESNRKAERDLNPETNGIAQAIRESNARAERDLNPEKNGVSLQFDPNNRNGFMGKVKDEGTTFFGKNGKGNQMLRKAGEIGDKIGDIYGTVGTGALVLGTALDATGVGVPLGVPLQAVGGAMMTAGAITKKGSKLMTNTADLIEKPKNQRGDDKKEATDLLFF